MYSTKSEVTAERVSNVRRELNLLHEITDQVLITVDLLRNQMRFVMRDCPPNPVEVECDEPISSVPLAIEMRSIYCKIKLFKNHIQAFMDLCDL